MDLITSHQALNADIVRKRPWKSAFAANSQTLDQLAQLSQLNPLTEQEQQTNVDRTQIDVGGTSDTVDILNSEHLNRAIFDCSQAYTSGSNIDNAGISTECEQMVIANARGVDEDDDIQIVHSTVTNPLIVYPHLRSVCGVHPYCTDDYEKNQKHCPKCYCYVCDLKASHCKYWMGSNGHCNAFENQFWFEKKRCKKLEKDNDKNDEIISLDNDSDHSFMGNAVYGHIGSNGDKDEIIVLDDDDNDNDYDDKNEDNYDCSTVDENSFDEGNDDPLVQNSPDVQPFLQNQTTNMKSLKFMGIKEIFTLNLRSFTRNTFDISGKMEGDLPQLNRQTTFYIEGVHIGWPYPKIMLPQRQIALHLIKAFKSSKHVAIESPTGMTQIFHLLNNTMIIHFTTQLICPW
jgi:hypothetical protein